MEKSEATLFSILQKCKDKKTKCINFITCLLFSSIFLKMDCNATFCLPLLFFIVSDLLFVVVTTVTLVTVSTGFEEFDINSRSSLDFSKEPCGFRIPAFFSAPKIYTSVIIFHVTVSFSVLTFLFSRF